MGSSTNYPNLIFKILRKRILLLLFLVRSRKCLLLKNIDWIRSSRTSIICCLFDSSFHPPFCTNIILVIFQLHLYHTTILNRHGDPNGKETQKTRSFVTNLFKVLKYLPHQGMFFPPANSGGLLIHLFSLPPDPGTFHQMCCNKGVIFTLAMPR